jgi:porin
VGKLSIDHDFIVPDFYNSMGRLTLINQTFFFPTLPFNVYDIPGLPPRYHSLASTPNAAPGAVLKWEPIPQWYAQAGVYGGNADRSDAGSQFRINANDGALAYFETGYRLNHGANAPGLEGSYKVGGYYHSGNFINVYDGVTWAFYNAAGFPAPDVREYHGNYGLYFQAEQQLFREIGKNDPARQGLLAFFRLSGAPADRNLTQFGVDGGLIYAGLIPGRDWDSLAFAVSHLGLSDQIRRAQKEANLLAPGAFVVSDHETVLELSYKVQATAWWTIQPSLQYVIHPGGSAAIPNATAFILQSTLRF